ncbi:MAG: hypothetical protein GKR89_11110 [Candidatus Latescibacteria bacterium]|nr:hypothetical protein [Candidatus Latescibacterota bacterium]
MKCLTIILLTAGLLLGARAHAHIGDRLYPIFELTDADLAAIDLHDGSAEDWLEIVGEPTMTAIEFSAQTALEPYDPADMDFRIWLAWHDGTDRIYAAMERVDDIYVNTFDRSTHNWSASPAIMQSQDSVLNLHLDGDHSGGDYHLFPCCNSDEEVARFAGQAQPYAAIGETRGDPFVHIDIMQNLNRGYQWGTWYTELPYADGGGGRFGENPIITVTEFFVTPFDRFQWDSQEETLVSQLSPGKTIGFKMTVNDRDEEESFNSTSLSLPDAETIDLTTADDFLDGLLLGPDGAIPAAEDDTAVEGLSWGRIKASFR